MSIKISAQYSDSRLDEQSQSQRVPCVTTIGYHHDHFVITDSPTQKNVFEYVSLFKKMNVAVIVRVCEPAYDAQIFKEAGIDFFDLPFPDGGLPSQEIIHRWLDIVEVYTKDHRKIAVH